MSSESSFQHLLSRMNQGEHNAVASLLLERFASRLAALAASHMTRRLQRRVDVDDVVQSVFATFFHRHGNGQVELRDWKSLWGLLSQIAVFRILKLAARHGAARRDLGRDAPLDDGLQALDREPGPADLLIAEELSDQLHEALQEERRTILTLHLQGESQENIAAQLKISLSTVERVLRRVREHLQKLLAEEEK